MKNYEITFEPSNYTSHSIVKTYANVTFEQAQHLSSVYASFIKSPSFSIKEVA